MVQAAALEACYLKGQAAPLKRPPAVALGSEDAGSKCCKNCHRVHALQRKGATRQNACGSGEEAVQGVVSCMLGGCGRAYYSEGMTCRRSHLSMRVLHFSPQYKQCIRGEGGTVINPFHTTNCTGTAVVLPTLATGRNRLKQRVWEGGEISKAVAIAENAKCKPRETWSSEGIDGKMGGIANKSKSPEVRTGTHVCQGPQTTQHYPTVHLCPSPPPHSCTLLPWPQSGCCSRGV